MTATSLPNSMPLRNALRVVRQNRKMMIVNCILYLLGIPLVIGAAMFEMICETNDYDFIDLFNTDAHVAYIVFGCIFLGIAVFMGMFIGIHAFTELHKKTKVDMLYALPLTGRQRFFSNYLGGCLMYIVPYLVTVILGWILIFAMAPFIQFGSDSFTGFQNLGEFFHEIGRLYGMGSMGLLLLMLLYYSLSVLVTVCCGTLFESLYTNVLLNCLIPGTTALIIAIICNEVGLDFEYSWQIVGFISPVGGLIYLFLLLSGDLINEIIANSYTFAATQTHAHEMLPSYLRWALAIVLVTAAVIVLAWQLYIRRKAEHVGKPFIYILAYYMMLTLVTISILCLMEADVIGPAILLSAIAYFVMEVIRRRGFKRFWVSLITYAATVAVSIGCFAVITLTDCFGRVNYVPAAAGVRSVVVEFADHSDMYNGPKYSHNTNYQLEYTDRDVISEITKLHREMVNASKQETDPMQEEFLQERWAQLYYTSAAYSDNDLPTIDYSIPGFYTQSEDAYYLSDSMKYLDPSVPLPEDTSASYDSNYTVELTYYTIAGTTIHRSYNNVTPDLMQQLLDTVHGTDLYAEGTANGLLQRFDSAYKNWDDKAEARIYPNHVDLLYTSSFSESYENDFVNCSHTVSISDPEQTLTAIADAYRRDLAVMTPEDFRTARINGYLQSVPVYETCKETLSLLHGLGIEDFNIAEQFGFRSDDWGNMSFRDDLYGIELFRPESTRTYSQNYPHSSAGETYFHPLDAHYADMISNSLTEDELRTYVPELYDVLKVARSNYVTNENCYVLVICGLKYYIPEAGKDAAEALLACKTTYDGQLESFGTTRPNHFDDSYGFNENSAF